MTTIDATTETKIAETYQQLQRMPAWAWSAETVIVTGDYFMRTTAPMPAPMPTPVTICDHCEADTLAAFKAHPFPMPVTQSVTCDTLDKAIASITDLIKTDMLQRAARAVRDRYTLAKIKIQNQAKTITEREGKLEEIKTMLRDLDKKRAEQYHEVKHKLDNETAFRTAAETHRDNWRHKVDDLQRQNDWKDKAILAFQDQAQMLEEANKSLAADVKRLQNELGKVLPPAIAAIAPSPFPAWIKPPADWHWVSSDHGITGTGAEELNVRFVHYTVSTNQTEQASAPWWTEEDERKAEVSVSGGVVTANAIREALAFGLNVSVKPHAETTSNTLPPGLYTVRRIEGECVKLGDAWFEVIK